MPEEPEIEMHEIEEKIDKMQEEVEEDQKENLWIRKVALGTALVAVFAAVGSMQSGAMVNEAMISQIKASDKWGEYQANKLKAHAYSIRIDEITDDPASTAKGHLETYTKKRDDYVEKAEKDLMPEAKKLEEEGTHLFHRHHTYSIAVTLAQVSIALSAVSVLTKQKMIWFLGLGLGIAGVVTMVVEFARP